MPRVILAPIFAVWFGLGIASKVALGVTLVFFIVFFNVYQGVKEVSPVVLANARMLGASRRQLLRHIYLPSATSLGVLEPAHLGRHGLRRRGGRRVPRLARKGVGYLILQAEGAFDINTVFAGILVLTAFALVLDVDRHQGRGAAARLAAEDRRRPRRCERPSAVARCRRRIDRGRALGSAIIPLLPRGGAVWQLVGLITRRSKVQILPPQPNKSTACVRAGRFRFWPG